MAAELVKLRAEVDHMRGPYVFALELVEQPFMTAGFAQVLLKLERACKEAK